MEKDQNRIPDSDRDFDIGGDNESILENKNRRRAENAGNEYSAPVRRVGAEAQRPVRPTGSEETLKRSSAAGVQNRSGAASGQTRGAAGRASAPSSSSGTPREQIPHRAQPPASDQHPPRRQAPAQANRTRPAGQDQGPAPAAGPLRQTARAQQHSAPSNFAKPGEGAESQHGGTPPMRRQASQSPVPVKPAAPVPAAKKSVPPVRSVPKTPAPHVPHTSVRNSTGAAFSDTPTIKTGAAHKTEAKNKNGSHTKAGADMMVSVVKAISYMVVIVVVSVFLSIFAIRIGNDVFAFVKSSDDIKITIPENATVGDVASVLHDNGVIKYPGIFKLYASLKHDSGDFVAGEYTVQPSMSYDKLRSEFKEHTAVGTSWITVPEGYTVDEIIDLMVENGIGVRDKYIDVINNYDFDYWFVKELPENPDRHYRLEGYLFPDTYEFYNSSSEEMVIKKFLDRFSEVFVESYRTKAAENGMSVDQVVTLASMIEKEAGSAADYMYVSSVFHNRLNHPTGYPRLQSDATVTYAIQITTGERPKTVTPEDTKIDNPYNTYNVDGLPPGAITNPGASAIRYALYPADTDYYYFVTSDSGAVLYGRNSAEHDQNIETVRKMNSDD